MKNKYNLYWGEIHSHTRFGHVEISDPEVGSPEYMCQWAKNHLNFFAMTEHNDWLANDPGEKKRDKIEVKTEKWERIQKAVAVNNQPGIFVTFLGFEWSSTPYGDHNVYYLEDYQPLYLPNNIDQLYEIMETHKAIVIPHHTGYKVGDRGKDWQYHKAELSPFVEIYSCHGSSECVDGPFPLNTVPALAPRCMGGTVQEALNQGYKLGIMASSDGHNGLPGPYGYGYIAVYADKLTRESLWDAFLKRRIYGVTGDRIKLDFQINGHFMGEEFSEPGIRHIVASIEGSDLIDRIEVIKNGRVIATHNHLMELAYLSAGVKAESLQVKLRIEWGWGKRGTKKRWVGELQIKGGEILEVEPCFQFFSRIKDKSSDFINWESIMDMTPEFLSLTSNPNKTDSIVVKIQGTPTTQLTLRVNSKELRFSLGEIMQKDIVEEVESERANIYDYAKFNKLHVHRAIPEPEYQVKFAFQDKGPEKDTDYYYLRVTQRNGQMAWSSPIWVSSIR